MEPPRLYPDGSRAQVQGGVRGAEGGSLNRSARPMVARELGTAHKAPINDIAMVLYDAWNAQMMEAMETVGAETIPTSNNEKTARQSGGGLAAQHMLYCLCYTTKQVIIVKTQISYNTLKLQFYLLDGMTTSKEHVCRRSLAPPSHSVLSVHSEINIVICIS